MRLFSGRALISTLAPGRMVTQHGRPLFRSAGFTLATSNAGSGSGDDLGAIGDCGVGEFAGAGLGAGTGAGAEASIRAGTVDGTGDGAAAAGAGSGTGGGVANCGWA